MQTVGFGPELDNCSCRLAIGDERVERVEAVGGAVVIWRPGIPQKGEHLLRHPSTHSPTSEGDTKDNFRDCILGRHKSRVMICANY